MKRQPLRLGSLALDLDRLCLEGSAGAVVLRPKSFDVLRYLVENAGRVVTKQELIEAVWPNVTVSDESLTQCISEVRRAIGDADKEIIRTVARRGYIAEAHQVADADEIDMTLEAASSSGGETTAQKPKHAKQFAASDSYVQTVSGGGCQVIVPAKREILLRHSVTDLPTAGISSTSAVLWSRPAPRLSIVVLPFKNFSSDNGQQYLADAITGDVTIGLSRRAHMMVISCNTAFTYRNKTVTTRQIGQELGVRYAIEGSVRYLGNQLQLNVQLIDAETDMHLWASRFDVGTGNLFALANDVSLVTSALRLELIRAEATRPIRHPDALDCILRGCVAVEKPASRENYAEAIGWFERALVLDPQSVAAQSWLAMMLTARLLDDMTDQAAADTQRAKVLAAQAVATSPCNPLAHFARGHVLRVQRRHQEATREYEAVLALDRNFVPAYHRVGQCKFLTGSIEEAIPLTEQAIRLSPRDAAIGNWYWSIGRMHLLQSRTEEAIQWFEEACITNPGLPYAHGHLASAYALRGQTARAAAELAEARKLSSSDCYSSIARLRAAQAWGASAPMVRALHEATYVAGLRKAGVPEQ